MDDQREFERIIEYVGQFDRLFAGERTGDGRAAATDGIADRRSGLQLTVEDDSELAEGAGVAFGDLGCEVAELLGAFVGELHVHVEGDAVVGATRGGLDDLTRGVSGLADVIARDADLAGLVIGVADGEHLVGRDGRGGAEHRIDRQEAERVLALGLGGPFGAVHLAELELGGLLERVDDVGIIGGVFAGQLDLQGEIAHGTEHGLGDAELIHALLHDLESLVDHVGAGDAGLVAGTLLAGFGAGRVDLEGEGHPALQVEAELEAALGADEELLQHDAVTLRLVGLADDLGFGEEERTEIDRSGATAAFADVT